jgi:hypothetical protein
MTAAAAAAAAETTTTAQETPLKPCDAWIEHLISQALFQIPRPGRYLQDAQLQVITSYLQKMVGGVQVRLGWSAVCMGLSVNIITIAALSTWTCARWTMIAHHTSSRDTTQG